MAKTKVQYELRRLAISRYGEVGWRQELAKEMRVDQSTVWRWDNGKTKPPTSVLILLRLSR